MENKQQPKMEKVIRENKVAVCYSPGFGAGWYTCNSNHRELIFHPKIVEVIESGKQNEIDELWIFQNLGIENVYTGGACQLKIMWMEQGQAFTIYNYDGSESIETIESLTIIA